MIRRLVSALAAMLSVASAQTPIVSSPRRVYTTYVGTGTGQDSYVNALAVDLLGYAYVAGFGRSDSSLQGFLTKLNQSGTGVVWSVGLPIWEVDSMALDTSGHIYIVGDNPPVDSSSVVIKLSPDATQTIYSTKIGGYHDAITVDAAGDVYVAGEADSTTRATPGAYMTTGGGAFASFAAKLDASGSVEYATYLDMYGVGGIAVDSMGAAWVVGTTCPAKPGQAFTECSGSSSTPYSASAAIRKLDASGAHVLVSINFGGGPVAKFAPFQPDAASGVAVDPAGSVWIVGLDESASVPTTPNGLEPQPPGPAGTSAGYALKLSSSGGLVYGTYVGYYAWGVEVDSQGRPYFAAVDPSSLGGSTIMALSADGTSVRASTVFAAAGDIKLDGSGGLYIAGTTDNTMFFATLGAYEVLYPGGSKSGYAAKYDLTTPALAARLLWMLNAASFVAYPEAPVAPGEIVSLFGQNLPSNPVVTFDGRPTPILYASATQINTVVPFEVTAPTTTAVLQGVGGYVLPVWPVEIGLFTADGSGRGQLAALNEDGSVNSSTNPAKVGSAVSVYMTGVGAMMPPIADGQLGPLQSPFPIPVLGVSALVNNTVGLANGIPAPVLYAGQAPGLIAGAVQVNVQVPAGTPSGNVNLTVYVGNYETQLGPVTIAVQ